MTECREASRDFEVPLGTQQSASSTGHWSPCNRTELHSGAGTRENYFELSHVRIAASGCFSEHRWFAFPYIRSPAGVG
jgi:hypothetical protein